MLTEVMAANDAGKEAKEQRIREIPSVVREFDRLCRQHKRYDLDDFEAARDYFISLSSEEQRLIRTYEPTNGEMTFQSLFNVLGTLYPCGVARKYSQYSLSDWARSHILLGEAEKEADLASKPQP
jgi:hypothetical protein